MTAQMHEESHLSVVHDDHTTFLAQRQASAKIPDFEGREVLATAAKISTVGVLDLEGAVFKHDEILKVVVEVQVNGIWHDLDPTGRVMTRMHKFKVVDARVVEWDLDLESLGGSA